LKQRSKRREDEEEDGSSYWMTSRRREDTVISKTKRQISFCGELASGEAKDLS
jgi:hypothetical protein